MHPTDQKFGVVIPVRFESSRFPGKPLIDLDGKSMVRRVWDRCVEAVGAEQVFIATDDDRIRAHCAEFTSNIVMTSKNCLTGTDRVAEAAKGLGLEWVINVQGDEPMIDPGDILLVRDEFVNGTSEVVNAMCPLSSEDEFRSLTVPKVAATPDGKLLYMSRAGIPGNKTGGFSEGWKQVCIYAFSSTVLDAFVAQTEKTPLEAQEDIEILRFLELGFEVRMVRLKKGAIAIDTPEDREKVLDVLRSCQD